MNSTFVYKLFKHLKKSDVKKFQDWLGMSSNKLETDLWLVEHLKSASARSEVIDDMMIHSVFKGFSSKKIADKRLLEISRGLKNHLTDFISFQSLKKDKHAQGIHLMREISTSTDKEVFDSFWTHTYKGLVGGKNAKEKQPFRTKYELKLMRHEFHRLHQKDRRKRSLVEIIESFDQWSLSEKLVLLLADFAQRTSLKGEVYNEFGFQQFSLDSLRGHFANSQGMQQLISLLTTGEIPSINTLAEIIDEFRSDSNTFSQLDHKMRTNIFQFIHNLLVRKSHEEGTIDLFDVFSTFYKWGLTEKLVFDGKELIVKHYDHIIVVFRQAERYDEAIEQAENLAPYLRKSRRKEAYDFQMGLNLFEHGSLPEAKVFLVNNIFTQPHYQIQARFALLQIEYDQHEITDVEVFIQKITNLYESIRNRKGISQSFRKVNSNRVLFFKKFILAYYPNEFRALRKEVLEMRPLTTRRWLLKKIKKKIPNDD